jgi:hypothetical protein
MSKRVKARKSKWGPGRWKEIDPRTLPWPATPIDTLTKRWAKIIRRMGAAGRSAFAGRRDFITLEGERLCTQSDLIELEKLGYIVETWPGIWDLTGANARVRGLPRPRGSAPLPCCAIAAMDDGVSGGLYE